MESEEKEKWDNAKLSKEKRRLKINWAVILFITLMEGVSYTSITTTFHQFVTNPRSESLGNHSKVMIIKRTMYTTAVVL